MHTQGEQANPMQKKTGLDSNPGPSFSKETELPTAPLRRPPAKQLVEINCTSSVKESGQISSKK